MNKIVNAILLAVISYIVLLVLVQLQIIHPNGLSATFGYIFILLALYPVRFFPEAISSRSWPNVEGEITTSEEEKVGSGYNVSIKPKIRYSYTVDGETYKSKKRIKIGTQSISSTDRGWVERTLEKYPLGQITVYYNPTLPEKAVVEPGFNIRIFFPILIGLIFYAISWIIGYLIAKSGGL